MAKVALPKRQAFLLATRLGFAIVIPLLVFLVGGRWLDRWRDTTPLFTIIGLVVGFTSTMVLIILIVRSLTKETEKTHE